LGQLSLTPIFLTLRLSRSDFHDCLPAAAILATVFLLCGYYFFAHRKRNEDGSGRDAGLAGSAATEKTQSGL